jgi:hypothetical protein
MEASMHETTSTTPPKPDMREKIALAIKNATVRAWDGKNWAYVDGLDDKLMAERLGCSPAYVQTVRASMRRNLQRGPKSQASATGKEKKASSLPVQSRPAPSSFGLQIETGTPIPAKGGGPQCPIAATLREMCVGHSTLVVDTPQSRVGGICANVKRATGARFVTRRVDGGVRVWRVA